MMTHYQITIPKQDEVFVPAINRLVTRSNGACYVEETKNAIVYEVSFPSREQLELFKNAVAKRLSKKIC